MDLASITRMWLLSLNSLNTPALARRTLCNVRIHNVDVFYLNIDCNVWFYCAKRMHTVIVTHTLMNHNTSLEASS